MICPYPKPTLLKAGRRLFCCGNPSPTGPGFQPHPNPLAMSEDFHPLCGLGRRRPLVAPRAPDRDTAGRCLISRFVQSIQWRWRGAGKRGVYRKGRTRCRDGAGAMSCLLWRTSTLSYLYLMINNIHLSVTLDISQTSRHRLPNRRLNRTHCKQNNALLSGVYKLILFRQSQPVHL